MPNFFVVPRGPEPGEGSGPSSDSAMQCRPLVPWLGQIKAFRNLLVLDMRNEEDASLSRPAETNVEPRHHQNPSHENGGDRAVRRHRF